MEPKNEFSYRVEFDSVFVAGFLAFFTVFWMTMCTLLSWVFPNFMATFWAAGAVLLGLTFFTAGRMAGKQKKYGYVRLDLDQIPYQRGEEGSCRIVLPRNLPDLNLDVELRCFRRSTVFERDSQGEASSREVRDYTHREPLHTQPVVQGGVTCFPLSFRLPAEQPASSNGTARGWRWRPTQADGIVWQLLVKAPEFEVELELPVFEVSDPTRVRRPA